MTSSYHCLVSFFRDTKIHSVWLQDPNQLSNTTTADATEVGAAYFNQLVDFVGQASGQQIKAEWLKGNRPRTSVRRRKCAFALLDSGCWGDQRRGEEDTESPAASPILVTESNIMSVLEGTEGGGVLRLHLRENTTATLVSTSTPIKETRAAPATSSSSSGIYSTPPSRKKVEEDEEEDEARADRVVSPVKSPPMRKATPPSRGLGSAPAAQLPTSAAKKKYVPLKMPGASRSVEEMIRGPTSTATSRAIAASSALRARFAGMGLHGASLDADGPKTPPPTKKGIPAPHPADASHPQGASHQLQDSPSPTSTSRAIAASSALRKRLAGRGLHEDAPKTPPPSTKGPDASLRMLQSPCSPVVKSPDNQHQHQINSPPFKESRSTFSPMGFTSPLKKHKMNPTNRVQQQQQQQQQQQYQEQEEHEEQVSPPAPPLANALVAPMRSGTRKTLPQRAGSPPKAAPPQRRHQPEPEAQSPGFQQQPDKVNKSIEWGEVAAPPEERPRVPFGEESGRVSSLGGASGSSLLLGANQYRVTLDHNTVCSCTTVVDLRLHALSRLNTVLAAERSGGGLNSGKASAGALRLMTKHAPGKHRCPVDTNDDLDTVREERGFSVALEAIWTEDPPAGGSGGGGGLGGEQQQTTRKSAPSSHIRREEPAAARSVSRDGDEDDEDDDVFIASSVQRKQHFDTSATLLAKRTGGGGDRPSHLAPSALGGGRPGSSRSIEDYLVQQAPPTLRATPDVGLHEYYPAGTYKPSSSSPSKLSSGVVSEQSSTATSSPSYVPGGGGGFGASTKKKAPHHYISNPSSAGGRSSHINIPVAGAPSEVDSNMSSSSGRLAVRLLEGSGGNPLGHLTSFHFSRPPSLWALKRQVTFAITGSAESDDPSASVSLAAMLPCGGSEQGGRASKMTALDTDQEVVRFCMQHKGSQSQGGEAPAIFVL